MKTLKFGIGDEVNYREFQELSGMVEQKGIIEGYGDLARKLQPEEFENLGDDEAYVIRRKDAFGNIQRSLVYTDDVISLVA